MHERTLFHSDVLLKWTSSKTPTAEQLFLFTELALFDQICSSSSSAHLSSFLRPHPMLMSSSSPLSLLASKLFLLCAWPTCSCRSSHSLAGTAAAAKYVLAGHLCLRLSLHNWLPSLLRLCRCPLACLSKMHASDEVSCSSRKLMLK
ncbi:unnamed protein product [Eretmochelys imbricata]